MIPDSPERKTKRLSFRADSETCKKLDEIAEAFRHIADGMSYDDVIRIDALGEILVTTMVHGEEME